MAGAAQERRGASRSSRPCSSSRLPKAAAFAWNFQDISERREVDRLKSEFVSTVSHELRTPLTSIRGSLGLLAGGALGELSPEIRDLLHMAERNSVRLTALINDILDFERLDSGRLRAADRGGRISSRCSSSRSRRCRPLADEQRICLVCVPTGSGCRPMRTASSRS